MVRLGEKWQDEPIRVVKVDVECEELLLATDPEIETELIDLIYQLPLADRVVSLDGDADLEEVVT